MGCDKKESPITLPSPGLAAPGSVEMGENYDTEIYYDFENNKIVKTSARAGWDLSFQSSPLGNHVFINGGNNVVVINTHKLSFASVIDVPAGTTAASWKSDASSGNPDSTGIGEWTDAYGNSKGEVYVVQLGNGDIKKLRLVSVSSGKYEFEFGDINTTTPTTVQLAKNRDCNFTYFSFANGVVQQEPAKTDWDVVFTKYRTVLIDTKGNSLPYTVCGALLNPGSTSASDILY